MYIKVTVNSVKKTLFSQDLEKTRLLQKAGEAELYFYIFSKIFIRFLLI